MTVNAKHLCGRNPELLSKPPTPCSPSLQRKFTFSSTDQSQEDLMKFSW